MKKDPRNGRNLRAFFSPITPCRSPNTMSASPSKTARRFRRGSRQDGGVAQAR